MSDEIVNKVASSGIAEINPEDFYTPGKRILIDIKENLWEGLALKEKDFRAYISSTDWSSFENSFVAITCSADAIVPTWAYMLLAASLEPYAKKIVFGNLNDLEAQLFHDAVSTINLNQFEGKKVVIKGCGKIDIPVSVYIQITSLLRPHVQSLMFGEPCSTVPVYKRKKE